jgi:hypothetical protein
VEKIFPGRIPANRFSNNKENSLKMKNKPVLKLVAAVFLPLLTALFIISEHAGWWDRYLGLTEVIEATTRFETSYAEVRRIIVPGDPAWAPMLDLIRRYSRVKLPAGREPRVLARYVAVASAKIDTGPGSIAEWTAPATPIVLLYQNWSETTAPPSDYLIVGTIGDLRTWIDKRRADNNFFVRDILLTITSVVIGFVIWLREQRVVKDEKRKTKVQKRNR